MLNNTLEKWAIPFTGFSGPWNGHCIVKVGDTLFIFSWKYVDAVYQPILNTYSFLLISSVSVVASNSQIFQKKRVSIFGE
jgi:hypothetical protein